MKPAIARCIRRSKFRPAPSGWNGGTMLPVPPPALTLFEQQAESLGLAGRPLYDLFSSADLRRWAEQNRMRRYVPEVLLRAWGMEIYERDIKLVA